MHQSKSKLLCLICLALSATASAQQTAVHPELGAVNQPTSHFLYKVGALKNTVLIVYVTSDFYDLYVWEKEALIEPLFIAEHAKSSTLATIALRDAKSGKTVGTYTPKTGISML